MATHAICAAPLDDAHDLTAELLDQGFCIIDGAISTAQAAMLDRQMSKRFAATPFCDGDFYGRRTKRFGQLLRRSSVAVDFVTHPLILAIAERVLGPFCDGIQLNLTQALEIHPGERQQIPHRDENMWRGPTGEIEYLINVMWPTTRYTADNGTTRIWTGSHRGRDVDPLFEAPVAVELEPGSALVFLGSTLHGAGANHSLGVRRGLIVSYCLGWLKPYENQWLAYPPSVARSFDPDLAALVGYRLHRPNLGGFDGQCPSVLLQDEVPEHLAATDALSPEAQAYLDAYLSTHG